MTNKMPLIGRKYRLIENHAWIVEVTDLITVESNIWGDEVLGVKSERGGIPFVDSIGFFEKNYEELEDNLQEKKEVSEVERALENLKKELSKPCYTLEEANTAKEEHLITDLAYTAYAAQNLVKALEAEKAMSKPEPEIFIDEGKVGGDYTAKARVSKDENGNFIVHEMVIEEPKIDMKEEIIKGNIMIRKWKKGDVYDNGTYVCQTRGESLFVVKHDCKSGHFGTYLGNLDNIKEVKHNIIGLANWFENTFNGAKYGAAIGDIDHFLDRAKSDLQRLDSFRIWTPELGRLAKECVEPVSIWNFTRDLKDSCQISSYQIWLYEIFINSFEQMQKDIEEIKRK